MHKDKIKYGINDEVIIIDFMPFTKENYKSNNSIRLHGRKPRRWLQEIKAIQKEVRKLKSEDE